MLKWSSGKPRGHRKSFLGGIWEASGAPVGARVSPGTPGGCLGYPWGAPENKTTPKWSYICANFKEKLYKLIQKTSEKYNKPNDTTLTSNWRPNQKNEPK